MAHCLVLLLLAQATVAEKVLPNEINWRAAVAAARAPQLRRQHREAKRIQDGRAQTLRAGAVLQQQVLQVQEDTLR
jgi:hypothetical protein